MKQTLPKSVGGEVKKVKKCIYNPGHTNKTLLAFKYQEDKSSYPYCSICGYVDIAYELATQRRELLASFSEIIGEDEVFLDHVDLVGDTLGALINNEKVTRNILRIQYRQKLTLLSPEGGE